ncbi:DUF1588 domain-containing protein [Crateriforma conspicua]|uniref:Planctomycete cytochrome C n=1 Tax=Crateriforma conspicua TaxID=2527996 RepID=A0A5C5XZC8_9PLAN|nr:DUF1588 domain-containing protein [Crateriforma conspicua]TWT68747.1 hypothetical protein Pan14r_09940 [Crateriforma conspicua]
MHRTFLTTLMVVLLPSIAPCFADKALLREHCVDCHTGPDPEGDFSLHDLGRGPEESNVQLWIKSLQRIRAGEMPPDDASELSPEQSQTLQSFLQHSVTAYERASAPTLRTPPRRLNNREFENSVRDVLLLDHVGTNDPMAMLLGDTLHDGFDTHGETLGISEFHLDQYLAAVRAVLDQCILSDPQPESQQHVGTPDDLMIQDDGNRQRRDRTFRSDRGIEIRSPRERAVCKTFPETTATGYYRISVQAKALDRHVYPQQATGIHDDDPLILRMHLGNRSVDFSLAEGEFKEFEDTYWLAAGTPIEFSFATDGLRLLNNGNFKFQYRIGHDHIKQHKPNLYRRVVTEEVPRATNRRDMPSHWVHWVKYWQGPRPMIGGLTIEGPFYDSWPPKRQTALLGPEPSLNDAAEILQPIARRAWRRNVSPDELDPIVRLVQQQADSLGIVGALKEGIVAILMSPSFLMPGSDQLTDNERFAAKFSNVLSATIPDAPLMAKAEQGRFDSESGIQEELNQWLRSGRAEPFLREFPYAWLQLDRINFMAPDVDRYPMYEKKRIGDDMVREAIAFFQHNVHNNHPIPELLTADYSFINADLATVYGLTDVPDDSVLRKYTFGDGRRGGFLGMGAFLTLTADTLSTSPIHRAVYVMENFMGIHPAPPPSDVDIQEPDIRSARTIREVLEAHRSDTSCAACHQNIDPFGYAFENFDPIGAWRDHYVDASQQADASAAGNRRRRTVDVVTIPVDASATFLSGARYDDVTEFRQIMMNDVSRDRFVRCFVTKFLTYANGVAPDNFSEIEAIVKRSSRHDYRIIDTMAAAMDSPLFRETNR